MADTTVALVDAHSIFRRGLYVTLEEEPDLLVVGEATDAPSALLLVEKERPQVVLLDLRLDAAGESDGLVLCSQLSTRFPDSRVLVLTTFAEEWLVLEAIRHGARGYLVKDVQLAELLRAIRSVHRGEGAFDGHTAGMVVRTLGHGGTADGPVLQVSHRERELLALLARGLSNAQIGQEMFISEATVKYHVTNVMRKLGVTRRTEAVYVATRMRII